jgi:hypothetical protein
MNKRHNEVLEHLEELTKGQKDVADNVEAMSDMSIISAQLMFHTALLADINESLAIIADKIGGAE